MNSENSTANDVVRGPALEELPTSGLQVEEPLDVESIELASRPRGPAASLGWETVQPGGDPVELLPDGDFDLGLDGDPAAADAAAPSLREQQLERENLQLAAELATLRAAGAERERLLESRLVDLAASLEERHAEIADQSAQIASLALERDGLRARLEPSSALAAAAPECDGAPEQRHVAGLEACLEARGRALALAHEELAGLREERSRLAEALAERVAQVARLLDELNRREARRRFDSDFRGALQRLVGVARRRPESAPQAGSAGDRHLSEAAATDTVVLDPPRPAADAVPIAPPAEEQRAMPRRFLLSMEPGSGEAHELTGTRVYVGRAPEAGVHITDSTVSRVHAVLRLDGQQVVVEDAASTNGVFVNGARVRSAALSDFDTVTFGNVGYLFRLGPAAEENTLRGQ
jgi:hypothetical protein